MTRLVVAADVETLKRVVVDAVATEVVVYKNLAASMAGAGAGAVCWYFSLSISAAVLSIKWPN